MPTPFYDDLNATLDAAWRLLQQGVPDIRVPAHVPTLATVGLDGKPKLRSIILRALDIKQRILTLHTDSRSSKLEEIRQNPAVSLHVYDAAQKIQLQLSGKASLHLDDAQADAGWRASRMLSRRTYLVHPGPGKPLDEPGNGLPQALAFRAPSSTESEQGRAHFALLQVQIETLDWLYLAHYSQRRAQFHWTPEGKLQSRWLVP